MSRICVVSPRPRSPLPPPPSAGTAAGPAAAKSETAWSRFWISGCRKAAIMAGMSAAIADRGQAHAMQSIAKGDILYRARTRKADGVRPGKGIRAPIVAVFQVGRVTDL